MNETISPVEQSEALGISVELYNKLVEVISANVDDQTNAGQFNITVSKEAQSYITYVRGKVSILIPLILAPPL